MADHTFDIDAAISALLEHEKSASRQIGMFLYESELGHPVHVIRDHMEEKRQQNTVTLFSTKDRSEAQLFYDRELARRQIEAALRGSAHAMQAAAEANAYKAFSNSAKGSLIGEFSETFTVQCPDCGSHPIDDCELCHGTGEISERVPVSWDTIKKIVKAAIPFLPIGSRNGG